VLVVEDDAPIRAMLADLLSDAGYGVIEASSGAEALSRLREQQPDLIVLDLMLPTMSGWEFLDRSRPELDRLNLPVMIVSAIAGKSDYPSTLGVAAWFTKPLDIPRFLSAVERLAGAPHRRGRTRDLDWSPPARVLIVEDEVIIRDLLCEHLSSEGFVPAAAETVSAAREQIEAQPPDLILLDLMLPDEDGWTFLAHRKSDAQLSAIPTVAISSAPHERLVEAKDLGADAFLSKPFDLDALTALIRSFVGT
jgi:CheY-like chemotaxis protein